jgi:hypothetical protein
VTEPPSRQQVIAERRRLRRHWILAGIPVAALLLVLSAKVIDGDNPCRAPRDAPSAETALLPAGLSFDQIGTVTGVRKDDRHIIVKTVTTKPPDEASVLVQEAVTAAGYRFVGADSEGVEAEVFFSLGAFAGGQAHVRPAACAGRWDIDLVLLDPDAVPSGTTPGP